MQRMQLEGESHPKTPELKEKKVKIEDDKDETETQATVED